MRRRTLFARGILLLLATGAISASAWADDWTSPKEVAKSAQEFATSAEKLQKAIKDIQEDSPLVAEVGNLSKSAARLHDSVDKGGTYDDAKEDFRKIEAGYARFEAALKKAHDIHHEKPVEDAAKKLKTSIDALQSHMAGRRPTDKPEQTRYRTQENNR